MGSLAGLPDLIWYEDIDSTNEEAKRLIASGRSSAMWLAARSQTSGRGRAGRGWISPQGNLYATVAAPNIHGLAYALRVPFALGVAAVRALKALDASLDVRLKWPNDLRVSGHKLGGILVETAKSGSTDWFVAGIGVNVANKPEATQQATACLAELMSSAALTADIVLESLMQHWRDVADEAQSRFDIVLKDWLAHAEGLGERFVARPGGQSVTGVFEGLEPDGALQLRLDDGRLQVVRAGDVELVRKNN